MISIAARDIAEVPPHMQRLRLAASQYDYKILYRPGKDQAASDALSRCGNHQDNSKAESMRLIQVHSIEVGGDLRPNVVMEVAEATTTDVTLCEVMQYIIKGFPESSTGLPGNILPYHSQRHSLAIHMGVVMRGQQVCIPDAMRPSVLATLHKSHYGVRKTLDLARTAVYWPRMSKDIESTIGQCELCQENQNNQKKNELKPLAVPLYSWQRVGIDVMFHDSKIYLVIVDYHSKYPTVFRFTKPQ